MKGEIVIKVNIYEKIEKESGSLLKYQVLSFILAVSNISLKLLLIKDTQVLIDQIIDGEDIKNTLVLFFIKLLLFFIMDFVDQYFFRLLESLGKNRVLSVLFGSLLLKEYTFFEKHTTGNLTSRLVNESGEIASWLSVGKLIIWIQVFSLIFTIYMMIRYSLILTISLLFLIFLSFLFINYISKKRAGVVRKLYEITAKINDYFIESIFSIKLIKLLKKELFFKDHFINIIEQEKLPEDKKSSALFGLQTAMMSLLILILPLVSVGIGAFLSSKGLMSVGSILGIYSLTSQLQEPISVLSGSISQYKTVESISHRFEEILFTDEEDKKKKCINGFNKIKVSIRSFAYDDKKLLENTNFTVNKGEVFVIKGPSGSGKSTLGALMRGLITLKNGKIHINNIDIKDFNKDNLWDYILGQDQEHFILNGNLYDNISFGDSFTKEEVNSVIKTVVLDDFVQDYGLFREINESGSNLSGGQKQRINLARIIIRKPELLILDEPIAHLDYKTSLKLVDNLITYSKENDITLVVISHNEMFDDYADEIYYLT